MNQQGSQKIDAYRRASNYPAAGQLYLPDTPQLRRPLKREDVKRKLIAHKNCIHEIGQDKGLLSLMLSLPEEWDYTTKGLARICKDGVDSICAGVRELEEHGYVIRQRVRNPNGQLGAIEYTILEQPRPPEPKPEKSERENPVLDNPEQASPVLEEPEQGNPAQLNTNRSSKEKSKNYQVQKDQILSYRPVPQLYDGQAFFE